jgi:hypothetical protein
VGDSKQSAGPADENGEETWVRLADGDHAVRLRALNAYIEKGGAVLEARLTEDEHGLWTIRLRLDGKKGEFIVNRFDSDNPRTYKDVGLAIASIYKDLRYRGAIVVSSERNYASLPR